MRHSFAVSITAVLLATGCSATPPATATAPPSAASSSPPPIDVQALVQAVMIPEDSLTDAGGPAKPGWPDELGAGWVSFICREPVGTPDLGLSAKFTRTWVDPDAWFVQVSTFAWTNHSGTQMLDRLRDATAACTEPFSMNQDLIAFTPEIKLPTYPEVAGFAHCARVKNGPDRKAGKNCYAYVAKGNALTKVELRNSGSGKLDDTLLAITTVVAQRLRQKA
ncbi:hypothetical protein [Actinoplanes sp. G11-F43]|uniref:hypothetical protein n=1 Tax=Actinoplanes sp. G11-F43 TaxID=3424130 RepID=UPI003D32AAA7